MRCSLSTETLLPDFERSLRHVPKGRVAEGERSDHYMGKEGSICVATHSRRRFGFTGCKDEYLVVPAETEVSGAVFPVDEICIGAFHSCDNLRHVVLMDGIEIIGATAFSCCTHLKSITLPDTIKYIGDNAFANCHQLRYTDPREGVYHF